jgi:hypothetical protein
MVFLLLSSNADPNSLNGSGDTPLIALVKSQHPLEEEIVRLLIRFGADVTARESGGSENTIFHLLNERMVPSRLLILLSSCSPSTPFNALNARNMTALKVPPSSLPPLLPLPPALPLSLVASLSNDQMSRNRISFLWIQLWMYHHLPSWIPIVSTSLNCLLFLILIDTLGWVYGLLSWTLLTFLFFDKVSQAMLETGVYRITQGVVCGYYLSLLWVNLRYFGGSDFLLPSSPAIREEATPQDKTTNSSEGTEYNLFLSLGRNIPSETTVNLSSPAICLFTCVLALASLLLAYLASVTKSKSHTTTEDRSRSLLTSSALSSLPQITSPLKSHRICLLFLVSRSEEGRG